MKCEIQVRHLFDHTEAIILWNARPFGLTVLLLFVVPAVAAAMAACNFVDISINKEPPLRDQESIDLAREDVNIINNALHFVNDLLRNMLDMHRAASKQLQVTMAPVDLLHDVLEPVGGMLYQRGSKVKLIVECPPDLFIMADCLRLKQVILNLGRNSTKFIDEGFIRLKAEETNGVVKIYVDDSGTGIPKEKQERLFAKFQESLDLLSQGTVSSCLTRLECRRAGWNHLTNTLCFAGYWTFFVQESGGVNGRRNLSGQ